MKNALKNSLLVLCSVLFVISILEIALRCLPVPMNEDWLPVTNSDPLVRHRPDVVIRYSKGYNFSLKTERRSNNEGFLNDQDYHQEGKHPLIGVVGDSFVEAMMVPYQDTLYGRIDANIGEKGRVYSFGISSAPLSQYLAWTRWVKKQYQPDALVIVIVANDFDESYFHYKRTPGFHYFHPDSTMDDVRLERVDYHPNKMRRIVLKSALARYLFFNLQINQLVVQLRNRLEGNPATAYVANMPARLPKEQLDAATQAAEMFLSVLPKYSGLSPEKILLLVDGVRPELYSANEPATVKSSYWGQMRNSFIGRAKQQGYEVVDMHEAFRRNYGQKGERFEFSNDNHWNSVGHEVAAVEVMRSALFHRLFVNIE